MVEFALTMPLVLILAFVAIDVGRLVYTYAAISSAAREGARIVSLSAQNQSDCFAIQRMEAVGQGFPLHMDPNSLAGNSDPNNPSGTYQPVVPPANTGYIYIWPAVASATPQEQNCGGTTRGGSSTIRDVAVEVQYRYTPLTPLLGAITSGITIKTVAVEPVEPGA